MKKLLVFFVILLMLFLGRDQRVEIERYSAPSNSGIYMIVCGKMAGTGVMVGPHTMTTAAHVVNDQKYCTTTVSVGNGNVVTVQLMVTKVDPSNDFAMLKSAKTLPNRNVNCDGVSMDGSYTANGYPNGERYSSKEAKGADKYYNVLKGPNHVRAMEGKVIQGMSGGPVLDEDGDAVGYIIGVIKVKPHYSIIKEYRDLPMCSSYNK